MTIYVDELAAWPANVSGRAGRIFGNGRESCHMSTDGNAEELHAFAASIGMRRAWFQPHPTMPHYDLTPTRRAAAVRLGAVETTRREQAMQRLRARSGG